MRWSLVSPYALAYILGVWFQFFRIYSSLLYHVFPAVICKEKLFLSSVIVSRSPFFRTSPGTISLHLATMLFSKPILSSLFLLLSTSSAVHAADIYVSPSGSDSAAGTQTAPLKSIQSAIASSNLTPGSTIYLRAGTYALTSNIQITSKGTSSSPYTLRSYSNEKVIIDAEALPYTPGALDASVPNKDRGAIHIEGASNWRFLGLEIIHGAYGVFLRDSNDCYFESIITRDNYETGFHMQGASAHNKVYYLDSYGNRDPRKNGESADGFACKEGSGEGNMLIGARLWNNVDDGLDLW